MQTSEFIAKAILVHGDKYDYSLAEYSRFKRTTIICKIHGPFEQRAKNHLAGRGCNACAVVANTKLKVDAARQDIIQKFKNVHGDRYDYSEFEYVKNSAKSTVICGKHGPFLISANNHLWDKGCRECYVESKLMSLDEFLQKATITHGDRYDYSRVSIKSSRSKVDIICSEHGMFSQGYTQHIQGNGCPSCSVTGYKPTKPARLYVLELGDITKIGITNRNVDKRVSQININSGKAFNVVTTFEFEDGSIPLNLETRLLRELKTIYEQPSEIYDGSTESFLDVDVPALLARIREVSQEYV